MAIRLGRWVIVQRNAKEGVGKIKLDNL